MTEMAKSHHQWSGETGYINEEMMAKYLGRSKISDQLHRRAAENG